LEAKVWGGIKSSSLSSQLTQDGAEGGALQLDEPLVP